LHKSDQNSTRKASSDCRVTVNRFFRETLSISGNAHNIKLRAVGEISAKCAIKSKAGNERKFRKIPFRVFAAPRKQIEKLQRAKRF
jgi:hypothetical protein